MAVITTRSGKGSPLTNAELDANFTNINTGITTNVAVTGGTINGTPIGGTAAAAGSFTTFSLSADQVQVSEGGTGAATGAAALVNLGERTSATGSAVLPSGTTAQRDGSPLAGYIRFNTTLTKFEGYTGTAWSAVGGGATGGGSDAVFVENDKTVTTDYTISTNRNAMATGPLTINSGVTVTVPSGSRFVVI